MLNDLKRIMRAEHNVDEEAVAMMEAVSNRNVRDLFLDDQRGVVIGAEEDPEIGAIVKNLPEYGGDHEEVKEEIRNLSENLLETNL